MTVVIWIGIGVLLLAAGGLALLIAGLVKRRTGVWVCGLVILVAVPVVALPMLGAVFWYESCRRQELAQIQACADNLRSVRNGLKIHLEDSDLFPLLHQGDFKSWTGLELPPEVTISHNTSGPITDKEMTGDAARRFNIRADTNEDITPFLKANFTAAAWADVAGKMAPPEGANMTWWDTDAMKSAACYRMARTDEAGTKCETCLAYTPAGVLYVVGIGPPGMVYLREPQPPTTGPAAGRATGPPGLRQWNISPQD